MQPLNAIPGFSDLQRQMRKPGGILEISGCIESQKAHMAAGLSEGARAVLLVAENELKARELYEDFRLYDRDALYYPPRDMIFYQADLSGNLLTKQRMQVFQALREREHVSVITCAGGCMDFLLPFRVLENYILTIRHDSEIDLEELERKLSEMGYERCAEVDGSGQFSVRGGILDVYPLTEELPWRIEFWGDEVDSIRSFDPETQRSLENLEEITVYPATEDIGRDRDEKTFYRRLTDTLTDYLPENSRIILDEPARIRESAQVISDEYQEAMKHRLENGQIRSEEAKRMLTAAQLEAGWARRGCAALWLMPLKRGQFDIADEYTVTARSVNPYNGQFAMLVQDLRRWRRDKYSVVLLSGSRTRGQRLANDLMEEGLSAFYSEAMSRPLQGGEVCVTYGSARRGFEYPMQKFVFLSESDIFGREQKKKKKKKPQYSGQRIHSFSELSVGDYVVHESHGLGVYRGIEKLENDHVMKDYVRIEYADGGNLYVPATSLEVLQKYAGAENRTPKLNRLGGREWDKTRTRVRAAVQNIAKELVQLYSARQEHNGFVYGQDTVWQKEFEEMFPFEETEDQLAAIEDTKRDMESTKIMDRLICGDVGFGKTEIAIRAAFKAVQDNKQVVVLAPTTILAQQHYNTFTQRMRDFPVRVDLLCRFRTAAQQKKTIEDTRKGQVDILIGTHRVLSKDVVFKDLGLLVVDEEQRFGVAHKERIKQMRENVDVLTLTATPIPRTLHMSLVGIRDMSILEEAPLDRLPIQTYVMEYSEEMVREAISRELARDGQVYYVYNRVSNIADIAARVQELVPEANVAYAHGQMRERELEQIMYSFINGEIDVLVSTTIIETGMDISNVNTIIVHDADRMGLSQLYQLRGRVGRTNRNAYAYLMYRRDKMLKEEAEKRLHAIREFTELGSGVRIAMRDLEIRGAGNLLGAEQHGHMEAVGYDLYCKMLSEAVHEAKGAPPREDFETAIDLAVNAFIPQEYIQEEGQKLDLYKRIAGISSSEEAEDMLDELTDRYGDPPRPVQNLIRVSEVKAAAHSAWIEEIRQMGGELRILLYRKAGIRVERIPDLLAHHRGALTFRMGERPVFFYKLKAGAVKPELILDQTAALMQSFLEILGGQSA